MTEADVKKSSSKEWLTKSRDDILEEIQELSRQRRDVESRLKDLDKDISRTLGRRDRNGERYGRSNRRYDDVGDRRRLASSVVAKRRREEDDDETDDDRNPTREGEPKRRRLYIRKSGGVGKPRNGDNPPEDDKPHKVDEEEEEGEEKPTVSSAAVVVDKASTGRRRPTRTIRGGSGVQKRDRRLFGMLMGHLGKAKSQLDRLRKSKQARKKKSMEEKVEARMVEVRHEAHEHAKRRAEKKKMKVLKNRDEILREQRKKHMLLLQLRLADHEKKLSNFIRTKTTPGLCWLPGKHNESTEKLLAKGREESEKRIEDGLVIGLEDDDGDIPQWRNMAEKREGVENDLSKDVEKKEDDNTAEDDKPEDDKPEDDKAEDVKPDDKAEDELKGNDGRVEEGGDSKEL
ncbi:hypothetical protein AAMO2058_001613000 [Amorphochlora amoebiformis]|uniref:Pinin/SDK/MemA protein domain-containing protein n=1 Tax=Amorphochlora amoebiformis TaxID=1561963 RepID=A0A7S0GT65_9EUKA|mmetsp:Transcript_1967/g.2715  ORF Transcript_1967/g.2715 Transcript_1967/m.2715 type:complete len:402 (+) Transcript_1967:44-1249(+)